LLANVAELRGDPQTALDLYQKTAELAEESNPQLTVVAKMRFGMLIQQPSFILGTPAAEGTPAAAGTPAAGDTPAEAGTPTSTPSP
jgi:hypothetical protein